jgi:hypothetical protein
MSKYKSEKIEDIIKRTNNDSLKMVLFNLKMVPTFSLVIEATYGPVHQVLTGQFPSFSEDDINSLIIAGACTFIFKSYDRFKQGKELKKILEDRGIVDKVDEAKSAITKILKIGADVLRDAGYSTGTMTGILGFSMLLQPFLAGINELMGRNSDFSLDNIFNFVVLGIGFKGAIYLEQLINNFVKSTEKDPMTSKSKKVDDKETEEEEPKEETYLGENDLKSIIDSIILK